MITASRKNLSEANGTPSIHNIIWDKSCIEDVQEKTLWGFVFTVGTRILNMDQWWLPIFIPLIPDTFCTFVIMCCNTYWARYFPETGYSPSRCLKHKYNLIATFLLILWFYLLRCCLCWKKLTVFLSSRIVFKAYSYLKKK